MSVSSAGRCLSCIGYRKALEEKKAAGERQQQTHRGGKESAMSDVTPLHAPHIRKFDFAGRALVFIALEFSFLGLAYRCLVRPIPIHLPPFVSPTEIKAATTIISVIWHTLAAFAVKDIVSSILSAECMAQYRRTGDLVPDETDRVSWITSGILAQTSYFLTTRPTFEYRLAFILVLLVVILGPLGPGVISPGQHLMMRQQEMLIANLTMTKIPFFPEQLQCSTRAARISQIEMLEGSVFGYKTGTDGMLIPWPEPGLESSQDVYIYETDVVVHNYSCRWSEFSLHKFPGISIEINIPEIADNTTWSSAITYPGSPALQTIVPLSNEVEYGDASLSNEVASTPDVDAALALSTFLFIGDSIELNLTSIDTAVLYETKSQSLAGILLCDPQFTTQKAQVVLSNGTLNATIILNSSLVGNFPESAANAIFSQALLFALGPVNGNIPAYGELASAVLLQSNITNPTNPPARPLPLSDINRNISLAIQSAAKAYISGYRVDNRTNIGFTSDSAWHNSTASVQYQQDSLTASKPTLIAAGALDVIIVIILAILVFSVNVADMELFSLRALEGIYHKESSPRID
ncbi:hypothetical protein P691DRAFT_765685 [Macrolepiota fuliginosa MF-IS2]|uniref:Uncharacterized protein n=1 Tax=Macrolepiota fuliginosa MF-IS2 TaxID=1400762 RepID=A0A9P5X334_9AGAR|nr:hypothetical protein P691DRAFT_765685 [Macrolepiota fuliginosa MF-IS2]